jgi:peptidoglycan/LPS O-acetylase OafA/YrhL
MYVCANVLTIPVIKQMPKLRILPFLGSISFYMFLWHTPVNKLLSLMTANVENKLGLFAISFLVSMFLSIIQHWLNNRIINPCFKKIKM